MAELERAFADYTGARYAIAVNSGGSAMFLALLCSGVEVGDQVLLNAFTLAPVPGSIAHAGAKPVYVECTDDYVVDLEDLEVKAGSTDAKAFMLSHMRGHIGDMGEIKRICDENGIVLIEDCAHTLGARWDGVLSGRVGRFGCFSLQAYKHINAGEGGVLITDDEDAAARAALYAGSYMLYGQNGAVPSSDVFARHDQQTPNLSLRMNELTAAVAIPQIGILEERGHQWNQRYRWLEDLLGRIDGVSVPRRDPKEEFIGSSIQFSLAGLSDSQIDSLVANCARRGVSLKWFGRSTPAGFTSTWRHWRYAEQPTLDRTARMLRGLIDMRIPLSLTSSECELIAEIISDAVQSVLEQQ